MEIKRTVEYEDGELILMEGGESDRDIYVLLEGQVSVTKETDKGQVTLALLEEGDIFGEVSFLAQRRGSRSATIAARGKVKIGILDHEKLSTEYTKLSPLFQQILKDLADRFSKTTALASRLAARRMEKPSLERREAQRSNPLQASRCPTYLKAVALKKPIRVCYWILPRLVWALRCLPTVFPNQPTLSGPISNFSLPSRASL
jgi:CRP-like cAMP-binding protein